MRLRHEQVLDAPVDTVWDHFTDLRRIGRCFPGAEVTHVDGDDFVGGVRARLGPFVLTFEGEGAMVLTDRHAADGPTARLRADGREQHGFGRATIDVTVQLTDLGAAGTRAALDTDLVFHGPPTDVGRGLVQRASDPLVERFLTCMSRPGGAAEPGVDDAPLDLVRSVGDLLSSFRPGAGRARARGRRDASAEG